MKPLLGAGAALLSGCLPFIVPPARVSAEVGPATGTVERPSGELEPHSVTTLRAGFHPLQLVEGAPRRTFDAGIGYQGDFLRGDAPADLDRRTSAHGPYLELGLYPFRRRVTPASTFRWGARSTVDLLFLEPHRELGYGGSLATAIELSGESKGSFSSSSSSGDGFAHGLGYGQWAIGGFLGASVRSFPDARYVGITAGLSARVPLVFGVACCLGLGDDGDDGDSVTVTRPRRERHETRPPPRRHVPAKPTPVGSLERTRVHIPAKPKPVDDG